MSEKKTESRQAMAMKATVQQKFGDACEYGENQINQWPRQYRFTRGTRMLELMDEIAVLLEMAQRKYRIKPACTKLMHGSPRFSVCCVEATAPSTR